MRKNFKTKEVVTNLFEDRTQREGYKPEQLIEIFKEALGCESAYKVTCVTNIAPPVLSRIKNKKVNISDDLLIFAHEVSGLSIREIKIRCGIPPFEPKMIAESAKVLEE